MNKERKLKIVSIITYLLLLPISIYFKYFPILFNSKITNIAIFSLFFTLVYLLVYGSFLIEKSIDCIFFIPQSLYISFISRAVPNLRLSYPPLHDPYYYYAGALNILQYGTLHPILGWWYEDIDIILHWPSMQILTSFLSLISNIDSMQFFRFQAPMLGAFFFLAIFILAKKISSNYGVALLSSLFASLSDIIVFYQSEYHPQGFAILIFILLLYLFIVSRNTTKIEYRYLLIIVCIAFTFSHYFTPLFLSLMFIVYLLSIFFQGMFLNKKIIMSNNFTRFPDTNKDISFLLLIIVLPISYHFLAFSRFLNRLAGKIFTDSVSYAAPISVLNHKIPVITSVLSTLKWGMFILAFLSILKIRVSKNINEFRLSLIFIILFLFGVFGNYLISAPLDRIIGYCIPFASIFASLTLFSIIAKYSQINNKKIYFIFIVLIASLLITGSFFNSQSPSYFFKDSKADAYYWYSNIAPSMDEYVNAGEWIGAYTPEDSKYSVQFDTRTIPFFYGRRSYYDVIYNANLDISHNANLDMSNYFLINPKIDLLNIDKDKFENYGIIFDNRELGLYYLNNHI